MLCNVYAHMNAKGSGKDGSGPHSCLAFCMLHHDVFELRVPTHHLERLLADRYSDVGKLLRPLPNFSHENIFTTWLYHFVRSIQGALQNANTAECQEVAHHAAEAAHTQLHCLYSTYTPHISHSQNTAHKQPFQTLTQQQQHQHSMHAASCISCIRKPCSGTSHSSTHTALAAACLYSAITPAAADQGVVAYPPQVLGPPGG